MKRMIWISYDLGIRGDYEGLYTWLDEYDAKECGDNLARLVYEFTGNFLESLQKEIQDSVQVSKKTRIYVIWLDSETQKTKGRFIFGKRKSPVWSGYATDKDEDIEDVED